jgi:predicted restriction endonuclease
LDLLQAAHLCPVEAGGCDDARNGLVFCMNHHRALDLGLLRLDPATLVFCASARASLDQLRVTKLSLQHLPQLPHAEALAWLWSTRAGM